MPARVSTGAGTTVADVREYLRHDEWEVALDLLAALEWPADAAWWDLLIEVADQLWLTDATGAVRLAPLRPAVWRDLRPSQTITMHGGQPVRGTATITERRLPTAPGD